MIVRVHMKWLMLLLILAGSGCATVSQREGVKYKVKIDGAGWSLGRAIEESTATCKFRNYPPSTVGQLKYRMQQDEPTILELLESHGYYAGSIRFSLNEEKDPMRVEIAVRRGDPFTYRQVKLLIQGLPDKSLARIHSRLREGQRVVAAEVYTEEERILDVIRSRGYPFPKLVRRTVDVDREQGEVDLLMEFDPGESAVFGPVRVEGLVDLKEQYIRRQVPWDIGDPYDKESMARFERRLLGSGLFSSLQVDLDTTPGEDGRMPVVVRATERDKRTIRLGASYSDVGPGVKGQWVHRSLFGGGERLDLAVAWNPVKRSGSGRFTRSGFLDARQSLVIDLDATKEMSDAYDSTRGSIQAMVLRDLTPRIQVGLGSGYKQSRVEQLDMDEQYSHVFFPVQAIYDNRDNRLNPVRGMQVIGRSSFFDDLRGSQSFLKTELEGRHYAMLWERQRLSSALRLSMGSLDGAAIEAVPADERFYAGGGGSVRGYEYQQIGPRRNDVPLGGDKRIEFSAELRMQPGPRLGYAAFVDGGSVYNESMGDYERSLRYGAGVGIRWFTGIGPLRADVAYPLNPSADQVERLQFYISLGQAF